MKYCNDTGCAGPLFAPQFKPGQRFGLLFNAHFEADSNDF
jgi:hypothetical protein